MFIKKSPLLFFLLFSFFQGYSQAIEKDFETIIAQLEDISKNNMLDAIGMADKYLQNTSFQEDYFRARLLLVKASSFYRLNEPNLSYETYSKAHELALILQDTVLLYHSKAGLANVFSKVENYPKSVDYFSQILDLELDQKLPRYHASTLGNMALMYKKMGNYALAISYNKKSLYEFERLGILDSLKKGSLYNNIGSTFLEMEYLDSAKIYMEQGLMLKMSSNDGFALLNSYENLADLYVKLGVGDEAKKVLNKAIQLKEQLSITRDLAKSYFLLTQIAYEENNWQAAKEWYQKALKALDSNPEPVLENSLRKLSLYLAMSQGDYSQAIKQMKVYLEKNDSLHEEERKRLITNIRDGLLLEIKEKENSIREKGNEINQVKANLEDVEHRSKLILIILLIALLFSFGGLVLFLWRKIQAQGRNNELLQKQYKEISNQKKLIERQNFEIAQKNNELHLAKETIESQNNKLASANQFLETILDEKNQDLIAAYKRISLQFENSPFAIIEFNNKLKLVKWPSQAVKMFGFTKKELTHFHFDELPFVHSEDRPKVGEILQNMVSGKMENYYSKNRNVTKGGDTIVVEWSNSSLHNAAGEVESVVCIAMDVTEREKALQKLENTLKEFDHFIYKTSHDLRAPVNRISGLLGLIDMDDKKQLGQYLEMINKTNEELLGISSRLNIVSEVFNHKLSWEQFDLKLLCEQIIESKIEQHSKTRLFFTFESDFTLINTDEKMLGLCIENLMESACWFAEDGQQQMLVVLKEKQRMIEITFSFMGTGVPPHLRDQVFDMFMQLTEHPKDTGLSLFTSKKAVEKMNGEIYLIRSKKPTEFLLRIPVY